MGCEEIQPEISFDILRQYVRYMIYMFLLSNTQTSLTSKQLRWLKIKLGKVSRAGNQPRSPAHRDRRPQSFVEDPQEHMQNRTSRQIHYEYFF